MAEASSRLWNKANCQRRQAFFNHRRTPSYPFQCKHFKDDPDFKLLGTCKAQALLQKLAEAWASFFELLQLKKEGRLPPYIKVSPPHYWKDRKTKKLTPKGIFVRNDGYRIDERLTSQLCSLCGARHRGGRVHRGLYLCRTNHIALNADVNGAVNIADDGHIGDGVASGSGALASPLLLRWDGCGWEGKSPRNTKEMIVPEARTRIPEMRGVPRL